MAAPLFGMTDPTGAPAPLFQPYEATPSDIGNGIVQNQIAQASAMPQMPPKIETPETVEMVGPDGELYKLPAANAAAAAAQGFKPDTEDGRKVREYNKEHPWLSPLTAWYKGALRGATMGVVDTDEIGWLVDNVAPMMGVKLTKEQVIGHIKKSEAQHGGLAFAGDIGGMLLTLPVAAGLMGAGAKGAVGVGRLAGGEAGAALARSWGVRTAAEGVALSIPKATREVIEGDPGRAAETVAWGVGGNLLFSGAMHGIGAAAKGLGTASTEEAANLASFRAEGDTRTRTATRKAWQHMPEAGGDAMKGQLLAGEFARKDIPRALQEELLSTGGKIEQHEKWRLLKDKLLAPYEGEAAFRASLEAEGLKPEAISELHDWRVNKVGMTPNEGVALVDGTGKGVDLPSLTGAINKVAAETMSSPILAMKSAGSEMGALAKNIDDMAASAMDTGKVTKFSEAMDWRRQAQDQINYQTEGTLLTKQRKKLVAAFDDELESQMGRIAKESGNPDLLDKYNKGQRFYAKLRVWEDTLEREMGQQTSLRSISLSDGNLGAASAIASAGMGAPQALVRYAAGAYAHKFIRLKGNLAMSRAWGSMEGIGASMQGFGQEMGKFTQAIEGTLPGATAAHKVIPIEVFGRFGSKPEPVSETAGEAAAAPVAAKSKPASSAVASYLRLADDITRLSSDPAKMQERISDLTASLMKESPAVATSVATHYGAMIQHLAQVMPKVDKGGNPYAPVKPSLSNAELQTFAERLAIADNPHLVQEFLSTRTLKSEHLETLFKVWPSTYRAFVERMQDHAMSGKAQPLDFRGQVQMSLLTGMPLTPHMKPQSLLGYQKMYTQESMGGAPGLQGVAKRANMGGLNGPGKATLTTGQRLEQR